MTGSEEKKGTPGGYAPRRAGEVLYVSVDRESPRPVTIACFGHEHVYEFAWKTADDGSPVITDLRVTSHGGAPITSNSLRRINTDVLGRKAQRYDTAEAAESGRKLRETVESTIAVMLQTKDAHTLIAEACDDLESDGDPESLELARELRALTPDEAAVRMAAGAPGLESMRITQENIRDWAASTRSSARPRGRKPLSREFLEQVADWARDAKADNSGAIYEYILERVNQGRSPRDRIHTTDTVKKWVRRCKDEGLLRSDELRQPRAPKKGR